MKTWIYLLSLLFVCNAAPVFAVGPEGESKEAHLQSKVESMKTELGLDDKQAERLKSLIQEKWDKKKAVKEEFHNKITAIKDEFKGKMKALLTPEQQKKYDAWLAEKGDIKGSRKGSYHEHKGSPMGEKGSSMEEKGSKKGS